MSQQTQTEVVNIKDCDETEWDVYIGRENNYYNVEKSLFSNPYTVKEYGRETAVEKYKLYVFHRYLTEEDFKKAIHELYGKTMACWCKPKDCHGDILQGLAEAFHSDEKTVEEYIQSNIVDITPESEEDKTYFSEIMRRVENTN